MRDSRAIRPGACPTDAADERAQPCIPRPN
jgi:hypothetical protein